MENNNPEVGRKVIENDDNINALNNDSSIPLHLAARYTGNKITEFVKYMIEKSAYIMPLVIINGLLYIWQQCMIMMHKL